MIPGNYQGASANAGAESPSAGSETKTLGYWVCQIQCQVRAL